MPEDVCFPSCAQVSVLCHPRALQGSSPPAVPSTCPQRQPSPSRVPAGVAVPQLCRSCACRGSRAPAVPSACPPRDPLRFPASYNLATSTCSQESREGSAAGNLASGAMQGLVTRRARGHSLECSFHCRVLTSSICFFK